MQKGGNLRVGVVSLIRARLGKGIENRLYRALNAGAGGTGQRANPRAGPDYPPQFAAFHPDRLLVERVDLVEPDDLSLLGQPVAVTGEFFTDHAIGAGDIVDSAIHQVKNHAAAFDMAEEAGTDAGTAARAFDQPGEVGQDKLIIMQSNDTELRL